MKTLRKHLLLTLLLGVAISWAAVLARGRLVDTYAYFFDANSSTGNKITAGYLAIPSLTATVTTPDEPGAVSLSWTISGGVSADHIVIQRAASACSGSPSFSTLTTVTVSPASYSDSGLSAGSYCYRVQSKINGTGWTSGYSNTQPALITNPLTTLLLHNDSGTANDSMSSTAGSTSTITINAGGGVNTWTYAPLANTVIGTDTYILNLVQGNRPNPTDSGTSGATANVVVGWASSTGSCGPTLAGTLVNANVVVPKVPSNTGNGVQFTFTPTTTHTFLTGEKLCLVITDTSQGASRNIEVETDTTSVSGLIGVKSELEVNLQ